jgi:hypothetical protein
MTRRHVPRRRVLFCCVGAVAALLCVATVTTQAQDPRSSGEIKTADLNKDVRDFLIRQITAHVAGIKTLDPPPDRVVGALTTGEFSWGTFMRTLAAYSDFAGTPTVAGHDIISMIAQIAPIELQRGGKTWAQLYAALALQQFGTDLSRNALWQSLSPGQRDDWKTLLDPGRFYDLKTHTSIHLPENYFGVAARIAAIDFQLGIITDRAYVDDLLDRAARQSTSGALFADDALPTGRYDRYSNEYARALYEAAAIAGRNDLLKALSPSLREQMRLWWDLLSPDGYGYSWGRSLGAISYMDTLEIVAFLGEHPEFRPAPLAQLASAYHAAWLWLRDDLKDDTHLLNIFGFGRGDYSYITREREWQQTTTCFGKIMGAHRSFMATLAKERLETFPARPSLPDVARFVFFRNGSGRKFGVWVVRQGTFHFALPFVTGPRGATSDYEPAPHGFPGFRVPVEQISPCFTPFLELEDGSTIAAADGADEIRPAADGRSVTAVWKNWVAAGGKAGETLDPGLTTEATWALAGSMLRRTETISSSKSLKVRRLWMAIPVLADHLETSLAEGGRIDRLMSKEGTLEVRVSHSDWRFQITSFATGDGALGRGDRGPIPLHLILQSMGEVSFAPGTSKSWQIEMQVR